MDFKIKSRIYFRVGSIYSGRTARSYIQIKFFFNKILKKAVDLKKIQEQYFGLAMELSKKCA